MREELLAYLLDAMDPAERESLELKLAASPELQSEFSLLSRALEPMKLGDGHFDPPAGLADRTCHYVMSRKVAVANDGGDARPGEMAPRSGRWSLTDLAVAAGILLAAGAIFFPAVQQERTAARLTACQENLRKIGVALTQYSDFHNNVFPDIAGEDGVVVPGIYAARLAESQLLDAPGRLICPDSELAARANEFRYPTVGELKKSKVDVADNSQRLLAGSYGYNLGYVSDRHYEPTRNLQRATFALMADAPKPGLPTPRSFNHGSEGGQNVLFEDGHVAHMVNCSAEGSLDNIFLNDRGRVAAGLHRDDAVISGNAVMADEDVRLEETDAQPEAK